MRCPGCSSEDSGLSRMSAGWGSVGTLGLAIEQSPQLHEGLSLMLSCVTLLPVKYTFAVTSRTWGATSTGKNPIIRTFLGKVHWLLDLPRQGAPVIGLSVPDGSIKKEHLWERLCWSDA